MLFLLVLVFNHFLIVTAEFNSHFAEFVEENYGKTFLDALQRTELGDNGSFGGKHSEDDEIVRDPVIFIHGVSDVAGGKMHNLAAKYRKKGYTDGELYGTSYGEGNRNNPLAWTEYSMRCEHVKQIRTLILAVRYYTLRDVDIVAYSLGVPIARKAILGGACVDTKEDLGAPLTNYIDSFVGVAGPNHGIALQIAGISIPGCVIGAIPILPICSRVIGLYSGLCPTESQFLTDINDVEHYEGRHVFSIYTRTDNWIGYEVCGQITARIPGEDSHKSYKKYNHDQILENTWDVQMRMIELHKADEDVERTNKSVRGRSGLKSKKHTPSRISVTTSEEEDGNSRARKRNIEDDDYLSDDFSNNKSPQIDSRKNKLTVNVARRGTGNPARGRHGVNVISEREKAEGTYRVKQSRSGPPAVSPENYYPTTTTTRYSITYKYPTTTPTLTTTTTTAKPQDKYQNSIGNLQKINSKTSTNFFPHPYESPDQRSSDGYHTRIKIIFDD
ncbi:unnamed protein product [Caenorhabditis angaria]|uniref:Uncharacterized protein n=1 Tax=Caenorhabditis angaria TaxID=860376 RepID=A0A9P1NB15_9PELO|nr:unnamed protein product [Caenorhabditis angaria]